MITANPPYIASAEIPLLEEEVREHDPHLALDGGEDGLSFVRRIIREAPGYLCSGGWLLMEIGYDQGEATRTELLQNGYEEVAIVRDTAGLDRVAIGKYLGAKYV